MVLSAWRSLSRMTTWVPSVEVAGHAHGGLGADFDVVGVHEADELAADRNVLAGVAVALHDPPGERERGPGTWR